MYSQTSLNNTINSVLTKPAHEDVKYEKHLLDVDLLQQHRSILADSDGQIDNYRITLKDGRDIHIKEYDDHYKIHWDHANPSKDPITHLIKDAPHWLVVLLLAICVTACVCYVASRSNK